MQEKSKTLKVSHIGKVPGHSMVNDWALPNRPQCFLPFDNLVPDLHPGRAIQTIEFKLICAKPNFWFGTDDFQGNRYEAAEVKFPGMLVQDMPNPCDLPYRMIDGRRRMEKLIRAGDVEGPFVVFHFEEGRRRKCLAEQIAAATSAHGVGQCPAERREGSSAAAKAARPPHGPHRQSHAVQQQLGPRARSQRRFLSPLRQVRPVRAQRGQLHSRGRWGISRRPSSRLNQHCGSSG